MNRLDRELVFNEVGAVPRSKKRSLPAEARLPAEFVPKFWKDVDGRFGIMREVQGRCRELVEDCNADSIQKKLLIERAVFLTIKLETMEVEALTTGQLDFGVYTQAVNALSGLLSKLGLEKKVKTPVDIKAFINGRAK